MAPFFANRSCDPFTSESTPCTLGNYAHYVVNVSEPVDISKTLAFAKEHNIRIVLRNTGHDYLGRSTGAGSIAIWTHHLKTMTITTHSSPYYNGAAIRLGAGVQAFEAYAFASAHNLAVVGGECPTVGLAGGYTQGGGHSSLSSKYGLGADQTLEWEVIDGRGNFLTATPTQNPDLYWALSGGGGGTYGVVWSLTVKAHADTPVSAANLTFSNTNPEAYYQAVSAYHARLLPPLVDAGAMSIATFTNTSFNISPIIAPDIPASRLQSLLTPFIDTLDALGIDHNLTLRQFPTYLSAYDTMQFHITVGVAQYGSRLIPRSVILQDTEALTTAFRSITDDGGNVCTVGLNVSKTVVGDGAVDNAVLPAWREALVHAIILTPYSNTAPWSTFRELQLKMTEKFIPLLTALSPGSGAYTNEVCFSPSPVSSSFPVPSFPPFLSVSPVFLSLLPTLLSRLPLSPALHSFAPSSPIASARSHSDARPRAGRKQADPFQPNFEKELYGSNYDRLEAVKRRYDPDGMFWVRLGVGSQGWKEEGGDGDGVGGRLCRVGT